MDSWVDEWGRGGCERMERDIDGQIKRKQKDPKKIGS